MAQRNVVLASGKRAVVSDEWIARWPEDIKEVLDDETPVKAPRRAKSSTSKPRKPRGSAVKKPAPEVPEPNNSSVDDKKET